MGTIVKVAPVALGIISFCNIPVAEAGRRGDCMRDCLGPNPPSLAYVVMCTVICAFV